VQRIRRSVEAVIESLAPRPIDPQTFGRRKKKRLGRPLAVRPAAWLR
jgi:hypothetical protein